MFQPDAADRPGHNGAFHLNGTITPDGLATGDDISSLIFGSNGLYPVQNLDFSFSTATPPASGITPASGGLSLAPMLQGIHSTGLVINAIYDTSITSLLTSSPTLYTEITGAISAAIAYYASVITTSITLNIDFGYGEANGTALPTNALGESLNYYTTVNYSTLISAMQSHGVTNLPGASPVANGVWDITYGQAQAFGLLPANAGLLDGYVGINNAYPLNFDPTNRAIAGQYDAIGLFEHEISEVMGRVSALGTYFPNGGYAPLDLFRYSSPGILALTPGSGYFSLDGGVTNLGQFNNSTSGGDAGDWASSVVNNSYDATAVIGVSNTVSATDLTLLNALGYTLSTACYAAGTHILTARGEIRVEDLHVGEMVQTRVAGLAPVQWIGQRRIDCSRHPDPDLVWPIRIAAGAFGIGQPHRDLWLSPDHAVAVDGMLIPIRLLRNDTTIRQDNRSRHIHYYHIELEHHDVLTAEGLAAESYLDTGNRGLFANADAPRVLHPSFAAHAERAARSCLPFADQPAQVQPIWAALAARAQSLGFIPPVANTTNDPNLCIIAGERRIAPIARDGDRYTFVVTPQTPKMRLRSRHAIPSTFQPWVEDRRRLGVMIQRISIQTSSSFIDLALDDPRLVDGWWAIESDSATMWRWTDGDSELPVPNDHAIIQITVGATQPYPIDAPIALIARAG